MNAKNLLNDIVRKSKGKGEVLNIEWGDSEHEFAKASLHNSRSSKELSGSIQASGEKLLVKIEHTNYSEQYARKLIRTNLLKLGVTAEQLLVNVNRPRVGSVITTRHYVNQLTGGQEVELTPETAYYAVDSDYIDCNERLLGQRFKAEFVEQLRSMCGGGSASKNDYTKFRLTKLL